MRSSSIRTTAYAAPLWAALALAAHAQSQSDQSEQDGWEAMEREVVRASDILAADVSNGLNPIGRVDDLVLSSDGSRVEYILYEAPYPYRLFGADEGFVTFDNVVFERGGGALDMEVRLVDDEAPQAPEELRLTADEARERLVSRLVDEPMYFSEEDARRVEDVLIDRETGEITDYVVETQPDTLFRDARRTVPAERVEISGEGRISASVEVAELDEVQEYESGLL